MLSERRDADLVEGVQSCFGQNRFYGVVVCPTFFLGLPLESDHEVFIASGLYDLAFDR